MSDAADKDVPRPPADDIDRIERALGWRPTEFAARATDRGERGSSARWIVRSGSRSAFVKVGATDVTARLFRREHENYRAITLPDMPAFMGFSDDGIRPVLAI